MSKLTELFEKSSDHSFSNFMRSELKKVNMI
jgi:hypothetical protein